MSGATCYACGQPWPTDTPSVPIAIAAQMLGVSRTRIYQLLDDGKLERHPDGGIASESVRARAALSRS